MRMLICSVGSKQCGRTLRFGAEVASALAADTTLLGVVDKKRKTGNLRLALDEIAAELSGQGLAVQVRMEVGQAEEIVMAEMERSTYDLVAVGALGGKRSRQAFFDSVGMRIVERARGSILLIRGSRPSLGRILICASGTEHGHMSVWAGAALACGAGAQATLLHVVDAMPAMYTGLERMEETLAELLQSDTGMARELKWAAQVLKAECEISELKLRRGIVAEEILREGQVGDHDLIVLGSSRYPGGLVRVFLGDVTREVVGRAQRHVLVVRPQE
jgi:nucleotide-binding universal stress UspA family protein